MPIYTFREHLTCFPNVKSFTFFTLELVYQVGRFAVGKGGDGISEAGVGGGERLGGDVDGTCLAAGTFAGEGSTGRGGGLGRRIWRKLGALRKWMVGGVFRKLRVAGSVERMWKPSRRIRLSFGRPG